MGQVPYDSAAMTEAICRAIQHVQARQRPLVKRRRINPIPAAPRCSSSAAEQRAGMKDSGSTVLSPKDTAVVIGFHRRD
jgi:hypothetical protein